MHILHLLRRFGLAAIALVLASTLRGAEPSSESALPDGVYAEFVTTHGTFTAELFYRKAPLTVSNFVGLAEAQLGPMPARKFFNGLTFHRVVPNFVVQGGDPAGNGEGGPGYSFADEFVPGLRHDAAGILSMANDGPDTNGSQFFFTLREVNRLNYLHSVFGRVVRGIEVLPLIQQGDLIRSVTILRVGAEARAFTVDRAKFDAMSAAAKKYSAPAVPGPQTFFDDPEHILPTEPPRALAFQRKLANYERATGRKIYVRILPRFTPEFPNQRIGGLAISIAKKIGLPPDSALAVYFAESDTWALWIGDDYLAQFTGRTGPEIAAVKEGTALHEPKTAFLAAAHADADRAIEDFVKHGAADQPITLGQRRKLQVDAVIDALLFKFEPHP